MSEEVNSNFDLTTILKFFIYHSAARKLEGYAIIEDEKFSFSAYRVPHAARPILRIDIKKEE